MSFIPASSVTYQGTRLHDPLPIWKHPELSIVGPAQFPVTLSHPVRFPALWVSQRSRRLPFRTVMMRSTTILRALVNLHGMIHLPIVLTRPVDPGVPHVSHLCRLDTHQ